MINVSLLDVNVEKPGDEKLLQYPWLWLRDNCQYSKCFHPVTLNRTWSMDQLDLTVKPTDAQVLLFTVLCTMVISFQLLVLVQLPLVKYSVMRFQTHLL